MCEAVGDDVCSKGKEDHKRDESSEDTDSHGGDRKFHIVTQTSLL